MDVALQVGKSFRDSRNSLSAAAQAFFAKSSLPFLKWPAAVVFASGESGVADAGAVGWAAAGSTVEVGAAAAGYGGGWARAGVTVRSAVAQSAAIVRIAEISRVTRIAVSGVLQP